MTWNDIILALYGAMSVVTFAAFAIDKYKSIRGTRRVPEARLHLLEALLGWPGAWLAIVFLRHKNRKLPFLSITATISFLHVVALAAAARYFLNGPQ